MIADLFSVLSALTFAAVVKAPVSGTETVIARGYTTQFRLLFVQIIMTKIYRGIYELIVKSLLDSNTVITVMVATRILKSFSAALYMHSKISSLFSNRLKVHGYNRKKQ